MGPKYILLQDSTMEFRTAVLYRIQALRDIVLPNRTVITAGSLGGWIKSEANLSQEGSCWVGAEAMVGGDAFVHEDALVTGHARVFGRAIVGGHALVSDYSLATDRAVVMGQSGLYDQAVAYNDAYLDGVAILTGKDKCWGDWNKNECELQIG